MRRLAYPMKVWLILLLIVSLIVPSLSPTIEATERSQQATSLAHIADTHVDAPPARDGERHVQSRFAAERRSSWSHSQSITATATPFPTNLLLNPGFELDANGDNRPDYWTKHHRVTRSSAVKYSGSYSMRHAATNNANYTIGQTVLNVVAGTNYEFIGHVNILPTRDTFSFGIEVRWINKKNATINTSTVKTYTKATSGWDIVSADLVAPAGTVRANIRMVVRSLSTTIYIDDVVFQTRSLSETPIPTNTSAPTTTQTPTATSSPVPTVTPTATSSPVPTATPTATSSPVPTATPRPVLTPTYTPTLPVAPTSIPTEQPTLIPTATAPPNPTADPRSLRLVISVSATTVLAGTPSVNVTVRAEDQFGVLATDYRGSVRFSSTSAIIGLPLAGLGGFWYTFTAEDAGQHTWTGVTLNTPGEHSITVSDGTRSATSDVITVKPIHLVINYCC